MCELSKLIGQFKSDMQLMAVNKLKKKSIVFRTNSLLVLVHNMFCLCFSRLSLFIISKLRISKFFFLNIITI